LKGLSSENHEGSEGVLIDRYAFQDVLLDLLFNFFSAPSFKKPKTVNQYIMGFIETVWLISSHLGESVVAAFESI
jgi:hypothetical protein